MYTECTMQKAPPKHPKTCWGGLKARFVCVCVCIFFLLFSSQLSMSRHQASEKWCATETDANGVSPNAGDGSLPACQREILRDAQPEVTTSPDDGATAMMHVPRQPVQY